MDAIIFGRLKEYLQQNLLLAENGRIFALDILSTNRECQTLPTEQKRAFLDKKAATFHRGHFKYPILGENQFERYEELVKEWEEEAREIRVLIYQLDQMDPFQALYKYCEEQCFLQKINPEEFNFQSGVHLSPLTKRLGTLWVHLIITLERLNQVQPNKTAPNVQVHQY